MIQRRGLPTVYRQRRAATGTRQGPGPVVPATDSNTNPAPPYNVSNPENAPFFANAGANFKTTVGGYLWNSAGDGNGDGLPDAGANFSQVTAAGIAPRYADTVMLSAAAPFVPHG
jgi:hypothetical protein